MIKLLTLLLFLIPSRSFAARALMEGIKATNTTIFVDTGAARVNISTDGYRGGISNVGLHITSNVVVSNQSSNLCVIYSSGSIACKGTISGAAGTGPWIKTGTNVTLAVPSDVVGIGTAAPTEVLGVGGSVNITGAYKVNTVIGADKTCTSGQYLDSQVVMGGITTNGTCTAGFSASANNVFTGQNRFTNDTTFTDSVYFTAVDTIGPQGFNTAVTNSSGTLSNVPFKVASANPAATSSSFTLTGLEADKHYHLAGNLGTTIAGYAYMRFNQDFSATVYDWTYQGVNSNSGGNVINGDNSDPMCRLHEASMVANANARALIVCDIYTGADYGWALCETVVEDANPFIENTHSSCRYNVATPTSIQIAVSGAGVISGKFYLTEQK